MNMEQFLSPLLLEPQYRDYIWGGSRLLPGQSPIAEAWIVYENDLITNGPMAGKTLNEAVTAGGPALLGEKVFARSSGRFPLLIKLLDCAQWLSLQVHPNDEQAVRFEGPGQYGKTEAWHIIEAERGAELLCGLKPGTGSHAFEKAIRDHKVLDLMERLEVVDGDSIFINPGMIHALGPGLLIYEVQQTSDLTYRVWDWDRPASPNRPLHIEKSLAVSDPFLTGKLISRPQMVDGEKVRLVSCNYFELNLIQAKQKNVRLDTGGQTFQALTVIQGAAALEGSTWRLPLARFQTVLVPADAGEYRLIPDGPCQVLLSQAAAG
jgi:mannose-6-phosphate isomerase